MVRTFEIAATAERLSAFVEHVYPSASVLPENLLKFYVHFSAPMSRGEAYQHLHLEHDAGRQVQDPFLELDQELWDREGRRLTLLLDPGRIKRGLLPNREVGPSLRAGHRYTLVIDANWRDALGRPLREEHRKSFLVKRADRRIPALSRWRIAPPKAGTLEPLVVHLPEPLDHSLLGRLLEVRDSAGKLVSGSVAIENEETEWRFHPAQSWQPGAYLLRVDTALEDLAGNRINRLFEVDRVEKSHGQAQRQPGKELPFRVSAH